MDIKRNNPIFNNPIVTQNDGITFVVSVFDNDKPFDLSTVSTFTLVSTRPDKQAVQTVGQKTGTNEITFDLGTTEISVPGRVDAAIQLYDPDDRVTSIPFHYVVKKDPATGYIPSEEEETLIQRVLGEGPVILQNAEGVTAEANELIANTGYDDEFDATVTYNKNNVVSYDGSSYMSRIDGNIGNVPTGKTDANWGLLAKRGRDGSVITVNGVEADELGNVEIAIPEPDLSGLASKAETITHVFNVIEGFGAVGDGIVDDTASIQAAIDAAEIAQGMVYLPTGTYRITSELINDSKIMIQGSGRDLTIILSDSCNGLYMSGSNSTIKDLTFMTNGTTHYGLTIEGDYMLIERVGFKGEEISTDYWERAIYSKRLWYSTFEDILIQNGELHTHQRGYGFYVDYSVNNAINNCNLLALDYCVYLSKATHPTHNYVNEGWTISNSILIVSNHGVRAMAGTFFDIHDCVIDIIYKQPIYMEVNGTGTISNNWISQVDNADAGIAIHIALGDRFTITGNVVTGLPTITAIRVDSSYSIINSNAVKTSDIGILVQGNYCVVAGNVCSKSTTYAIRVIGTYGQVQGNTYDTASISITHATTKGQNDKLFITKIVTLTGGSSQYIDIAIGSGLFNTKPRVGIIQVVGDYNIVGSYLLDDPATTVNNARFIVKRSDGTPLPNVAVRFSIVIGNSD